MYKKEKVAELIQELAARFFIEFASKQSMITVTGSRVASDLSRIWILFTVYPETQEGPALEFATRKRRDFREYVKKNSALRRMPSFEFEIDKGEKNRQLIDTLT